MLAVWLATIVSAHAIDLAAGEFQFAPNADTLPKGDVAIHPLFYDTIIGLSGGADIKFPLLGLLAGPAIAVEARLVDTEDVAVSLEPGAYTSWTLTSYEASTHLHVTGGVGEDRANLSVGGVGYSFSYTTQEDTDEDGELDTEVISEGSGLRVPVSLGYDWVRSPTTVFNFALSTPDVTAPSPMVVGLADWTHGRKTFRISLGVYVIYNADWDALVPESLQDPLPTLPRVVPAPHLALWWRV
jgi:hypothetical protein